MTIGHFQSTVVAAIPTVITGVVVSGGNIQVSTPVSAAVASAGIRINTDGTIDQRKGTVYTQISPTTDWITPTGDASSSHEVRITAVTFNSGSGWLVQAEVDDTWIDLSSNREWTVQDANPAAGGIKDVDLTLEIRLGSSGPAIDSGAYNLVSEYENV